MSHQPGYPTSSYGRGSGSQPSQGQTAALGGSNPTAPLGFVLSDDFAKVIRSITRILGSSHLAEAWQRSILEPLLDNWSKESNQAQHILLARARGCYNDLMTIKPTERRGIDNLITRGRLPPLQQLLEGVPLLEATRQSERMRDGEEWFPSIARAHVLEVAKTSLQTISHASYNGGNLFPAYWQAFDAITAQVPTPSFAHQCLTLSDPLVKQWSKFHLEEQMFSVQIFRTLASFFADISKHRVIAPALYGLWIPTSDEAKIALQAVRQEAFDGFISFVRSLPPPSSGEDSAAPHQSHSTHASPGHASSSASSQLNSHGHHLDHNHPTYALSHSHSSLNHRIRRMYGVE